MTTETRFENGILTVTRTFDAPRKDVFDAWIETSKVQLWWGCGDTTKVVSEIEPKVGGKYFHMMTIKGAGEFPMNGLITEFDPPSRLAYTVNSPVDGPGMSVIVDFTEQDNQTEVCLTHQNIPQDFSGIVQGGWTAAFDKLDRFLLGNAEAA